MIAAPLSSMVLEGMRLNLMAAQLNSLMAGQRKESFTSTGLSSVI